MRRQNRRIIESKTVQFWQIFALITKLCAGLENGLARTPPMGWMSWGRFRCEVDCQKHPDTCIHENLYAVPSIQHDTNGGKKTNEFQEMADRLVRDGYRRVGYNHIHIDDCFTEKFRCNGELCEDKERFPSGIRRLANYIHERGLRLGVYADYGTLTCEDYPGSLDHLAVDARRVAEWDSDYLKFDGCNSDVNTMKNGYSEMQVHLNETGRQIFFSCGWPLYAYVKDVPVNYEDVRSSCNSWRNYHDIEMSWESILGIIDYYDANPQFAKFHGPGGWFDPDMIIVGNPEITLDQARVQLSIWSIWSAPLIMSNDLRIMPAGHKELLQNKAMIAIDQDPLGRMGTLLYREEARQISIYRKPMTPILGQFYSYALAFVNRGTEKQLLEFELGTYGLFHNMGYIIEDVWGQHFHGVYLPNDTITIGVNPTGVVLLKATLAEKFDFCEPKEQKSRNFAILPKLNKN